jgi:dihydropteroate synthase
LPDVLNVTPDSFSDGNKFFDPAAAVGRMLALEAAGVDVIDIGQLFSKVLYTLIFIW